MHAGKQQDKKHRPFINGAQAFNIRLVRYKVEMNLNLNAKEKRKAAFYIHSLHHPLVHEVKGRDLKIRLHKKRFAN